VTECYIANNRIFTEFIFSSLRQRTKTKNQEPRPRTKTKNKDQEPRPRTKTKNKDQEQRPRKRCELGVAVVVVVVFANVCFFSVSAGEKERKKVEEKEKR